MRRRKAEVTVLTQKRRRLEQQLEVQERERRALKAAGDRLQVCGGGRVRARARATCLQGSARRAGRRHAGCGQRPAACSEATCRHVWAWVRRRERMQHALGHAPSALTPIRRSNCSAWTA